MSSYNTITKIKYTGNPSDIVKLDEYIVFQDDKAKRKYIVFKFVNNVTQQLLGMEFEVCQYNADENLIEKSVVSYNKFLASAEEEFVPKAKLRVSYNCSSISIRLIRASFDRFVWNEGEYEDSCYKFDQFYRDENNAGAEEEQPKHGRAKRKAENKEGKEGKKEKPKKKKKSKRPFIMRDTTKKNLAKFPVFFNVVVFIAVIGFSVASLIIFKNSTTHFSEGDYELRIVQEDEVAVCGYWGTETSLKIPAKLGKYTISYIDTGAFKKSKIETVEFSGIVTINTGAFVNCNSLKEIKSAQKVTVKDKAFDSCANLSEVYLTNPGTVIYEEAFFNCPALKLN